MINIDQYYNECTSIIIPQDETNHLFKMWHKTNDNSYREKIILGNIGIIEDISNKFNSIDPAIDKDDILQSGMIGLINAVDTFDYQNKRYFIAYANIIIYRAINWYIYRNKCYNNTESLDVINIEDIKEIEDSDNNFEEEIFKKYALHFLIDPVLNKLSPRDRSIMIDYFGFDGNESIFMKDIAKKNNISPERTRQIIAKSLRKIKCKLINKKSYCNCYFYL